MSSSVKAMKEYEVTAEGIPTCLLRDLTDHEPELSDDELAEVDRQACLFEVARLGALSVLFEVPGPLPGHRTLSTKFVLTWWLDLAQFRRKRHHPHLAEAQKPEARYHLAQCRLEAKLAKESNHAAPQEWAAGRGRRSNTRRHNHRNCTRSFIDLCRGHGWNRLGCCCTSARWQTWRQHDLRRHGRHRYGIGRTVLGLRDHLRANGAKAVIPWHSFQALSKSLVCGPRLVSPPN